MSLALGKGMFLAPFGLLLAGQSILASYLGTELADAAGRAMVPLHRLAEVKQSGAPFETGATPATDESTSPTDDGAMYRVGDLLESQATEGAPSKATGAKFGTPIGELPVVRVRAATVLRLAQTERRPTGILVAARGRRPPGLQLSQISVWGLGVRDGDVLTDVFDVSVTSVGQVIALVVQARGARVPVIVGRLWRGQYSYQLVVEQPYLAPSDTVGTDAWSPASAEGASTEVRSRG